MADGDIDPSDEEEDIARRAYDAFKAGQLREAALHFAALVRLVPDYAPYHYMRGLAHKYLREWQLSLDCNLRSIALRKGEDADPASQWNAGIAATALGDWAQARRLWRSCGIELPDGDGPIESDFGVACVRLNPWGQGEVVYGQRLDPVRLRLFNVPLPESGFRYGDVVLHDGAATGRRRYDDNEVFVFNALQRLEQSPFRTFAVFVTCDTLEDLLTLEQTPDIGNIEDWTGSIVNICLRCSYGAPHTHGPAVPPGEWNPERTLGIAAFDRTAVDAALGAWAGRGRRVDDVQAPDFPLSAPAEDQVWWLSPTRTNRAGKPGRSVSFAVLARKRCIPCDAPQAAGVCARRPRGRRSIMAARAAFCMSATFVALLVCSAPSRAADRADQAAAGAPQANSQASPGDENAAGHPAASYDSSYAAGTRGTLSSGNTPEDDARPGEYYFGVGVHAFQHKDFHHAVEMYQVAASWAYKPAEYNLAIMYARGQGIGIDMPRALAWVTLAAERDDKRYVQAREIIRAQLTQAQRDQAAALLDELKKTYGDDVALRRAKARWAEVRNNVTGSHVGFAGNVTVGGATNDIAPAPLGPAPSGKGGGHGGAHSGATTAGDVAGAEVVNGATAYRQLRESDNPYDAKFRNPSIGTATVDAPVPVKDKADAAISGNTEH